MDRERAGRLMRRAAGALWLAFIGVIAVVWWRRTSHAFAAPLADGALVFWSLGVIAANGAIWRLYTTGASFRQEPWAFQQHPAYADGLSALPLVWPDGLAILLTAVGILTAAAGHALVIGTVVGIALSIASVRAGLIVLATDFEELFSAGLLQPPTPPMDDRSAARTSEDSSTSEPQSPLDILPWRAPATSIRQLAKSPEQLAEEAACSDDQGDSLIEPGSPGVVSLSEELAQRPIQTLERHSSHDREWITGTFQVDFNNEEREFVSHIAFCPPLAAKPEIDLECMEGHDWTVKTTAIYPFGMRVHIRRRPGGPSRGNLAFHAEVARSPETSQASPDGNRSQEWMASQAMGT